MGQMIDIDPGINNYVDPARSLTVLESRSLGNPEKCWYCGAEGSTNADHFYPKSLGGRLKVRSCKGCNSDKADLTPLEWMNYLRLMRGRWQRNKVKSLESQAAYEIEKLNRMIRATLTLWLRVKHSVKSSYCPIGTIVSKQKSYTNKK